MRVRRLAVNARRQPNVASSGALVNQAKIPIQPDKEANNWSGPVVRFFVWLVLQLYMKNKEMRRKPKTPAKDHIDTPDEREIAPGIL
jgi:hypothetical protein